MSTKTFKENCAKATKMSRFSDRTTNPEEKQYGKYAQ
jgi:hypothetical protein